MFFPKCCNCINYRLFYCRIYGNLVDARLNDCGISAKSFVQNERFYINYPSKLEKETLEIMFGTNYKKLNFYKNQFYLKEIYLKE